MLPLWWCDDDYEGKDLTPSAEVRRECASRCVKGNNIQGYLAYCEDEVMGWCKPTRERTV